MINSEYKTARQIYVENRQRRQNKVFAIVTIGMASALALGLLIISGVIGLPFGNEFSHKVTYARAGDIPCPTQDAKPSDPGDVQVQVLNGTTRSGIAGDATRILESIGYKVSPPENAQHEYPGAVEISTGPAGVDDAWTLARLFSKARVTLTEATDRRIYITLGSFYDDPLSADEALREAENTDPLEMPEKCMVVDPVVRDEILAKLALGGDTTQSEGSEQSGSQPQSE